jgi:hypothetical protein
MSQLYIVSTTKNKEILPATNKTKLKHPKAKFPQPVI